MKFNSLVPSVNEVELTSSDELYRLKTVVFSFVSVIVTFTKT